MSAGMELAAIAQWVAFSLLAAIAIAGALGMTTTMSMFRSGIFLMASFVGVAGLFILLLADLLALLQVMMYVGGMLVMILFMVLFSHDPGGAMMAGMMKLRGPEWFFSLGLTSSKPGGDEGSHGDGHAGDGHGRGDEQHAGGEAQQRGGSQHSRRHEQRHGGHHHQQHGGQHQERQGGGMSMAEMSMFTPIKMWAAVLAGLVGMLLVTLVVLRPGWAVVSGTPDPDSPRRIGHLLMGKYMIAFEGAGLLILLGIFGAVMIARPGRHPDAGERQHLQAAVAGPPAPIEADTVEPMLDETHEAQPGDDDDSNRHGRHEGAA